MIQLDYGNRLRNLRESRNLSQQDLADRLKINRSTYARYELGQTQPDFSTLQSIADFYDVSIDYILGRTNVPSRSDTKHNDSEIEKLVEDPDFMVAYKEYPGSPEEAKEDLIGFLKLIKERDERKKKK